MSTVVETALSPASEKLQERLARSPLAGRIEIVDNDLPTLECGPADWPALALFLRDDPECRYDLFLDLFGVDNLRRRAARPRFETLVHLHSLPRNAHVRVRMRLTDPERPSVPTVTGVYPAAASARPATTRSGSPLRRPPSACRATSRRPGSSAGARGFRT